MPRSNAHVQWAILDLLPPTGLRTGTISTIIERSSPITVGALQSLRRDGLVRHTTHGAWARTPDGDAVAAWRQKRVQE